MVHGGAARGQIDEGADGFPKRLGNAGEEGENAALYRLLLRCGGTQLSTAFDEALDTEDTQRPFEVVAVGDQARLAASLLQPAHQKMISTHPALEGAEGVLAQRTAVGDLGLGFVGGHVLAVTLNSLGVLAAGKPASLALRRQALPAQRAAVAFLATTDVVLLSIAVLDHRLPSGAELAVVGAAVAIGLGIVAEVATGEAPVGFGAAGLFGDGHADGHALRRARTRRCAQARHGRRRSRAQAQPARP